MDRTADPPETTASEWSSGGPPAESHPQRMPVGRPAANAGSIPHLVLIDAVTETMHADSRPLWQSQ